MIGLRQSQAARHLLPVSPVCRTRFAMLPQVDQAFQDHHVVSGQALPGRAM
jgi:hypothetical protein